jgi:hypothetical protein
VLEGRVGTVIVRRGNIVSVRRGRVIIVMVRRKRSIHSKC